MEQKLAHSSLMTSLSLSDLGAYQEHYFNKNSDLKSTISDNLQEYGCFNFQDISDTRYDHADVTADEPVFRALLQLAYVRLLLFSASSG